MEPVRYLDVYVWEQYRQMYGRTDLPPSLPLPPADPFTRIPESSYRREGVLLNYKATQVSAAPADYYL